MAKEGFMSRFRLAVFDVDGTLTRVESCWQFIHERLGTWEGGGKVNAQLYFSGKISYEDWARLDAALWKGVSLEKIRGIVAGIQLMDGVEEVFDFLRKNEVRIALLTAGLNLLAERIAKHVPVDCYIANELEVKNGILTGRVRVRTSLENKGEILNGLLEKFNAKPKECLAVGDDETMIPVFKKVGLGIAFNTRSLKVEKYAKVTVKAKSLKEIIPHIEKYMKCKSNV